MNGTKRLLYIAGCCSVVQLATALAAQEGTDAAVFEAIRREGLQQSHAEATFNQLAVVIGPRLTASPAHQRAAEWARDQLVSYGLGSARLEPFAFGRGWTTERISVEMLEPRYMPLLAYADAWSASTHGDVVGAPVFIGGKAPDAVKAMQDSLRHAIVLTQPMVSNFIRTDRPQPTSPGYAAGDGPPVRRPEDRLTPPGVLELERTLQQAAPAVLIKTSRGEFGTVFVGVRREGPPLWNATTNDLAAIPSITLAAEHYNLIARLVQQNVAVKLRVNLLTKFHNTEGGNAYNVLAELPGTDPALRDQVVMIGAHLDSHHAGSGATDNADGVTTIMEAARILMAIGAKPRRTIRFALWAGEEQGLLGSKAWIRQHLAGPSNAGNREQFDVYFNIDAGTGPIYGWFLENDAPARMLFDAWLEPLKSIGARHNVIEGTGGSDHLNFIDVGVPAFNPIQDYMNYDTRTHHTNMDTEDRVALSDLRQSAVAMAWFAYSAAMNEGKVPWPTRK